MTRMHNPPHPGEVLREYLGDITVTEAAMKLDVNRVSRLQSAWLKHGVNEMAEKLTTYDPAEDLTSDEAIAIFMAEAFQTNDAGYIAHALGVVARAKGMTQIAGQPAISARASTKA